MLRVDEFHPNKTRQTVAQTAPAMAQSSTPTGTCTANSHNIGPLPQWLVDAGVRNNPRLNTVQAIKTNSHDHDAIWATAWLEHHAHLLTIPGSIAMGSMGNLNSPGNISLISEISDLYAEYKQGKLTKGQYDYRRAQKLKQLQQNLGPVEKLLFGNKTTQQSLRIARGGGIPATAHITRHADRVRRVGQLSKAGGLVLMGVGVTASCMQIANTENRQEKNEVFVETVASTSFGLVSGYLVGIYLISNPIGWGTAIVLAVGSAAISYGSGRLASVAYDVSVTQVDLVKGIGVEKVCR